jgi:hypothetical protein
MATMLGNNFRLFKRCLISSTIVGNSRYSDPRARGRQLSRALEAVHLREYYAPALRASELMF